MATETAGLKERLKAAIETAEIEFGDGDSLTVRGLTGRERAEFAAEFGDVDEEDVGRAADVSAWIASRGIIGDDGERVYTDDEVGEVAGLPAKLLDAIATTVMSMSRMTEESVEEGKGDSAATARNVGGGDSRSTSDSEA